MIQFLALQVRMGKITIEQVPATYREAVEALLEDTT
jgi:hypothetical protein